MRTLLLVMAMVAAVGVRGAEAQGAAPRVEFPWVLWVEYRSTWLDVEKLVQREEGYFIADALESKKECLTVREQEIARKIKEDGPRSLEPGMQRRGRLGNILLWRTGDKSARNMLHSEEYLCYPVGLEPGWRKKKE